MDRQTYNQLNRQQKESWPVRLALKYGAKDKEQATKIVLGMTVVLLIITAILYSRLFSENSVTEELSPAEMAEMDALNSI